MAKKQTLKLLDCKPYISYALCATTYTLALFHLTLGVEHKNWMFYCLAHDKNGPKAHSVEHFPAMSLFTLQYFYIYIHLPPHFLYICSGKHNRIQTFSSSEVKKENIICAYKKLNGHKNRIVGADQYQRFKQNKTGNISSDMNVIYNQVSNTKEII